MTQSAKIVQLIHTESTTGKGIATDPGRVVHHYWDFEGKLIATVDEWLDNTRECQGCDGTGRYVTQSQAPLGVNIGDKCCHCNGSGRMEK